MAVQQSSLLRKHELRDKFQEHSHEVLGVGPTYRRSNFLGKDYPKCQI